MLERDALQWLIGLAGVNPVLRGLPTHRSQHRINKTFRALFPSADNQAHRSINRGMLPDSGVQQLVSA